MRLPHGDRLQGYAKALMTETTEALILQYVRVAKEPSTKWEIAEALGLTFSSADHSLRSLRKAGLIECVHSTGRGSHYKWKAIVPTPDLWRRNEDDQLA